MGVKGAACILCIEARDAAEHCDSAQDSPRNKDTSSPNVNSAKSERLYIFKK